MSSPNARELEVTTAGAFEEKAMLITVIEEARATINDLQEDLRSQEAAVLDLSQQLASSHLSRDDASKHAARTIQGLSGTHVFTGSGSGSAEERKGEPDEF